MNRRNCWSCALCRPATEGITTVAHCGVPLANQITPPRLWRRTFAMVAGMPPLAADHCPGYRAAPGVVPPLGATRTTVVVTERWPINQKPSDAARVTHDLVVEHDDALRFLRTTVDGLQDENADLRQRLTALESRGD